MKNKFKIPANVQYIIERLHVRGFQAVLAGGCARDMLLGREPSDYDIATDAFPVDVENIFEKTIPVGKAFGVIIVVLQDEQFEVATFRKDGEYLDGRRPETVSFTNMKEDAERRDFTINALFYNPSGNEILDFVNGRQDLKNKIIRFVGEASARICEDHLRMLRAIRFAVKFDFEIEQASIEAIKENASLIKSISAERIAEEMTKILKLGKPRRAFELLEASGLLFYILPEVLAMKSCEQNPVFHPEGRVLEHTIRVLEELEKIEPHNEILEWAALLHDIAKPLTFKIEDNVITNHGHDDEGALLASQILRDLKFSNNMVDMIAELVGDHMRVKNAPEMRISKVKRLLAQENIELLLKLGEADSRASHCKLEWLEFILRKQKELPPEKVKPITLINGYDLIELGLKPGPIFGRILERIYEMQLEGEIATREKAVEAAKIIAKNLLEGKTCERNLNS